MVGDRLGVDARLVEHELAVDVVGSSSVSAITAPTVQQAAAAPASGGERVDGADGTQPRGYRAARARGCGPGALGEGVGLRGGQSRPIGRLTYTAIGSKS